MLPVSPASRGIAQALRTITGSQKPNSIMLKVLVLDVDDVEVSLPY